MTLVRIIKDWYYPDLFQQTPGGRGEWDGVRFTDGPVDRCDYVIICNRVPKKIRLTCPPENIWQVSMEPPIPAYDWYQQGFIHYAQIYTQKLDYTGPKFIHSHGALPWHIGRSYDELCLEKPTPKTHALSWVTSDDRQHPGQQARITFLDMLRTHLDFALWGKGFRWIDRKWDALSPYHYTLAIENYRGPHYWSEKIADAFLAWTMPIYYGATNITDYFPEESMAIIDINDPQTAVEQVCEIISSNRTEKNRDAIAHARELVLEKYQFFPFFVERIRQHEQEGVSRIPHRVTLPVLLSPAQQRKTFTYRVRRKFGKLKRILQCG